MMHLVSLQAFSALSLYSSLKKGNKIFEATIEPFGRSAEPSARLTPRYSRLLRTSASTRVHFLQFTEIDCGSFVNYIAARDEVATYARIFPISRMESMMSTVLRLNHNPNRGRNCPPVHKHSHGCRTASCGKDMASPRTRWIQLRRR